MRGVVTLAAAQTLPRDTPQRELLVLVAFLVAVGSLVLQGYTLPILVRRLALGSEVEAGDDRGERRLLDAELSAAALAAIEDPGLVREDGTPFPDELRERAGGRYVQPPDDEQSQLARGARDALELRLTLIGVMRVRLTEVSSGGSFSTPVLRRSLARLDAEQLSLQLQLEQDD